MIVLCGARYTRLVIRGELDRLHLGDLLQWLQMGGLSGRLTLGGAGRERRLDFVDGRVVFVSSQVPEERLASWLAAHELVSSRDLRAAVANSLFRRVLLTDLLLKGGHITNAGLRSAVNRLAQSITASALQAGHMAFTFDPAFPVRDLLGLDLGLEPNQLLLEAARRTDEGPQEAVESEALELPFVGAAFEQFFWELLTEAIPSDAGAGGDELARCRALVRDVLGTLAQWLSTSPGLVPLPADQATAIAEQLGESDQPSLSGHPHAAWNAMVVACAVPDSDLPVPATLAELERAAGEIGLWSEMACGQTWHRPHAGRIDELTSSVAANWSQLAGAAAPALGLEPGAAELAAHLLVVPTDLVLWVLATVPIPRNELRLTLLRRLPHRLALGLGLRATFSETVRTVLAGDRATAAGVALHLARPFLDSAALWQDPVPEDESCLLEVAAASALAQAAGSIKEAAENAR